MTDSDASRQFETSLDIRAPRDVVWAAISTAAGLERWFARDCRATAEVGGEVQWSWGEHHVWTQRVEVVEPGKRLRTRYDSAVDDGAGGKKPLFIEFLLEGDGGMTTLRLVQSGFGDEQGFDEEYDGISHGWPVELRSLRLYVEGHAGKDRKLAWSTKTLELDSAEAWRRLTGPDGMNCGTAVEALAEGAPFAFTSVDGDTFEGVALHCHRRQFSGDATSHGGGFLRLSCEAWAGATHVWMWLGVYDQDAATVAAIESRWDAMLERLFVGETAAEA